MYYIQETDKSRPVLKLLNIIKLKDNKIILPIGEEEIKIKTAERLAKKTNKIFEQTNSRKIVLSKIIKEQKEYVNLLNSYNMKIVDGKWLFKIMMEKVLEYIIKKKSLHSEEIRNINFSK